VRRRRRTTACEVPRVIRVWATQSAKETAKEVGVPSAANRSKPGRRATRAGGVEASSAADVGLRSRTKKTKSLRLESGHVEDEKCVAEREDRSEPTTVVSPQGRENQLSSFSEDEAVDVSVTRHKKRVTSVDLSNADGSLPVRCGARARSGSRDHRHEAAADLEEDRPPPASVRAYLIAQSDVTSGRRRPVPAMLREHDPDSRAVWQHSPLNRQIIGLLRNTAMMRMLQSGRLTQVCRLLDFMPSGGHAGSLRHIYRPPRLSPRAVRERTSLIR
jgi:hypothetical protein